MFLFFIFLSQILLRSPSFLPEKLLSQENEHSILESKYSYEDSTEYLLLSKIPEEYRDHPYVKELLQVKVDVPSLENRTFLEMNPYVPHLPPDNDHMVFMKRTAKLASIGYCPHKVLESWSCHYCKDPEISRVQFVTTIYGKVTDTRGYIAVDHFDKSIVVTFRGSYSVKNWIYNLMFFEIRYPWSGSKNPNVKIHHGFAADYFYVREKIFHSVGILLQRNPDYKLIVTGHSLGGALAVLCGLDLLERSNEFALPPTPEGPKISISVVTFGEPRVGNKEFSDYFSSLFSSNGLHRVFRVTNAHDVVPHLPPRSLNFHHHSREIWISHDEETIACDRSKGEDPSCSDISLFKLNAIDHMFAWDVLFGVIC